LKKEGNEMYYEQIIRGEIAAERMQRIADACAKAKRRRRRRWQPALAAGLEIAARARRRAARAKLQS
jgi:hypothetical protein